MIGLRLVSVNPVFSCPGVRISMIVLPLPFVVGDYGACLFLPYLLWSNCCWDFGMAFLGLTASSRLETMGGPQECNRLTLLATDSFVPRLEVFIALSMSHRWTLHAIRVCYIVS